MPHDLNAHPVPIWQPEEPPALPNEDIFGNTKKLHFIADALKKHTRELGRPPSILDFGCGNATAVGQYVADGSRPYLGVDFHEPSLEHARALCQKGQAEFMTELPHGRTFDAIIYADLLEHVHNPTELLKAHVSQLAEDGIVVASVPNGYGPCEIEKWFIRNLRLYDIARGSYRLGKRLIGKPVRREGPVVPYNSASGHVVFFTRDMLVKMAEDAGLVIRRFGHGGFVGADLTGSTIFSPQPFLDWNVNVSDKLPSWAVSTWYFEMVKAGGPLDGKY